MDAVPQISAVAIAEERSAQLQEPELELHARAQYVHALPGRLRIRTAQVRGCSYTATRIEAHLSALPGVHCASASALTGSVLVRFRPEEVEAHELLRELMKLGVLEPQDRAAPRTEDSVGTLQCPGCRTPWVAPDAEGGGLRMLGESGGSPLLRKAADVVASQILEAAAKRLLLALL